MARRRLAATAALLLLFAAGAEASADEVTDQIDRGLAAYAKKDLKGAATALDAAVELIRQKQAARWKSLLPAPLSGWSAQDAEVGTLSPDVFGGALTVSRKYEKAEAVITVSIVANSPMVQALASFLTGGFGAMLGGGDLVVIDGRRLLHSKNDNSYLTMVANAVLVKVQGNSATADQALRRYVGAIDFGAIERLAS
jgi:hypothetical protein